MLDEFLNADGEEMFEDPLKRVVLQHDLWAVYDHLIDQNIQRRGDRETRRRRDLLCSKLARCIQALAISKEALAQLPDTYTCAIESGEFAAA
ncbi:MAG: hypothetical protein R3C02_21625 [Planctomycetaceae bacterium]